MSTYYPLGQREQRLFTSAGNAVSEVMSQYYAIVIDDFFFRVQPMISGYITMDLESGIAAAFDGRENCSG